MISKNILPLRLASIFMVCARIYFSFATVFANQIFLCHFPDFRARFICFVALRPKSTAMVIAGRSVHLTHFFLGRLEQAVNQ